MNSNDKFNPYEEEEDSEDEDLNSINSPFEIFSFSNFSDSRSSALGNIFDLMSSGLKPKKVKEKVYSFEDFKIRYYFKEDTHKDGFVIIINLQNMGASNTENVKLLSLESLNKQQLKIKFSYNKLKVQDKITLTNKIGNKTKFIKHETINNILYVYFQN
jgi:hypothetical protein